MRIDLFPAAGLPLGQPAAPDTPAHLRASAPPVPQYPCSAPAPLPPDRLRPAGQARNAQPAPYAPSAGMAVSNRRCW